MSLVVSHLDKSINHNIDFYLASCLQSHLFDHYGISGKNAMARATFDYQKGLFFLNLNIDYKNYHLHAHEAGSNLNSISLKAVKDLSKQYRKKKK